MCLIYTLYLLDLIVFALYKCAALWRAVYGAPATKIHLGPIHKEKGAESQFRVAISSRYDLSCLK